MTPGAITDDTISKGKFSQYITIQYPLGSGVTLRSLAGQSIEDFKAQEKEAVLKPATPK